MFSLAALALLGLRYLGVHTAFGDDLVPALTALLEQLNTQLHAPANVVGHGAAESLAAGRVDGVPTGGPSGGRALICR